MAPVGSKDLLALEHRSKEQHLERLLASRTKPNIERLHSTVLQDVQRFLPMMEKANESLEQTLLSPMEALGRPQTDSVDTASNSESPSRKGTCFELDKDYEGPAIEMNIMLAPEEQIQMIANMEAAARGSQNGVADSDESSSMSEDSEPDSISDDETNENAEMEVSDAPRKSDSGIVVVSSENDNSRENQSGNSDEEQTGDSVPSLHPTPIVA